MFTLVHPIPSLHPHLVTGATGFVGSAIVLELLLRTDATVVGVVRGRPDEAPTRRLRAVLHGLIEAYALPQRLHAAIDARVHAVEGDLQSPACGVAEDPRLSGAEVWHSAASLQYQDRHQEQIYATNVDGTRNVVALARRIGAQRLNHVSTAYVAGTKTGLIQPEPGELSHTNNHYERSKILAEALATESGLPTRILRPGIVIGHGATRHALNYNGLYGFIRGLWKFRNALDRAQAGLGARTLVHLRADAEGDLGLVSVDAVAAEAVGLSLVDAAPGIYHLTNPTPPTTGLTMRCAFESVGLPAPALVRDFETHTALDRKLQQGVDFYNAYLVAPKRFDRSATDAALGDAVAPGLALGEDALRAFCDWYVEILDAAPETLRVAS